MTSPPKDPASARLHVALNVADLERSTRFYAQVFGVEPDKVHRGYARFALPSPPLVLSLNEGEEVVRGSRLSHLGVRLGEGDSLAPLRERLVATGHLHKEEHETNCCHAIQNKLWVVDPDGNAWEFYELVDDDPRGATLRRTPAPATSAGACGSEAVPDGRSGGCC